MNNNSCSLGIDLGTGSVKAALLDGTGARLGVASAPVGLSRPRPGWVESDPEDWWAAVKTAVRDVLSQSDAAVGAVGLSGQMHGVVLARSDGALCGPPSCGSTVVPRTAWTPIAGFPLAHWPFWATL